MPRIRRIRVLLVVLVCALDCFARVPVQNASESDRVVTIPVTVTTRTGEAVADLTASDFVLLLRGRKTSIQTVHEVTPVAVGKNRTRVAFVVLDSIGSPLAAQGQARGECLRFLAQSVVSNTAVSLLEIDSDGLRAIHQVGTPNSVLVSSLLQMDSESHFLENRDQLQKLGYAPQDKSMLAAELDRLRAFRHGTIAQTNMMRTFLAQLRAFQTLANSLERVPGRKTVVWLTGYFPVEINNYEDSININSYGIRSGFPVKSATVDYQKTVDLLNDAQVSIFPVQFGEVVDSERTTIGLRQLAQSTGGELLNFSDSLDRLVERAENQSGVYYLLTFRPDVIKTDLKWEGLKVKLVRQSGDIRSPNGLFLFALQK
jgi:VWFA-related protein